MAVYAENNAYLSIDGIDVSAYWTEGTLTPETETNETTHGSGTDWKSHAVGLKSFSAAFKLVYDLTDLQTYIDHIAPGQTVAIIWGPEGNTAGKPKHDQDFILTAAPTSVKINKEMAMYDISAISTGTPRSNMYGNDTF